MKQYVKPETESFQTTPNCTLCASVQVGVELGTMKVKDFTTPILVFALLISGLLTLPSCKNGNGDVQQPSAFKKGEVVTITTNPIGAGNKTPRRVHIGSETSGEAQLVWSAFDQLKVIVPSDGTPFPSSDFNLTDGVNTKIGIFTGTMPADGSEVFLAYPCGNVEGSKYESNVFTFNAVSVPNVQDFTVGAASFNAGLMPVVGYGTAQDDKTITAKTAIVGGALRVKLTNKTGEAITFNKIQLYVHDAHVSKEGTNTSVWASSYTVGYNVSTDAVTPVTPSGTSADNNNIVLNLSQEVTLANDATSSDFYFVMVAPLYFETKAISGGDASFTVYLFNHEGKVTSPSDLETEKPVATTSFNYNIDIAPGDIVEGTLEMTTAE